MRFLVATLLFGFLHIVLKGQDTLATLPLSTISANRIQDKVQESAKSIQIIDREQISQLPVQSIQEALQYAAGLQLRPRSLPHVQTDISIRGGGFDQVLILIDGVKLNDAQTGHHAMNIPIPLEAVERIEIIKGPSARIFGPNAYSGAINIITRTVDEAVSVLGIYGGSYNSLGGHFYHAEKNKKLNHQFSVRRDYSDGFRENTDYDIAHYYYKASYQQERHRYTFQSAFSSRDFGANGFYAGLQFTDQYEEIQTSFAALQHQYDGKNSVIRTQAYWRRNQDKYLFLRSDPNFYRNFHLGNNIGIESHATFQNRLGTSALGLDIRTEILRSNLLGNRERLATALYAEHQFQFWNDRLTLSPGVLFNHYSDHGFNLLPGIESAFRLSPAFTMYASAGNTFRVPTYTDLYYISSAEEGNPDLKAETAFSLDAGIRFSQNGFYLQAAIFQRNNRDLIDWSYITTDSIWRASNIQNVLFQGFELDLKYRFQVRNHWVDLQQIQAQYTYIDGDFQTQTQQLSRYTLNHLRHQLTATITTLIASRLRFQMAYRAAVPFQNLNDAQFQLETFNLIDMTVTYPIAAFEIQLEIINTFNEAYTGANLIPLPGRMIRLGLAYTF